MSNALVEKYAEKYHPQVIKYKADVNQSLATLRALFPRYAAFVAQPEEAGREFVVKVHRLTRKLDDDPYTNVLWGIVTGYSAADALRIARARPPAGNPLRRRGNRHRPQCLRPGLLVQRGL